MPSLARRRRVDLRDTERFESEVRQTELADPSFAAKRKFQCGECKRVYEEKSRNCPRCDKHTMGELLPIPEQYREEARRRALRDARAKLR